MSAILSDVVVVAMYKSIDGEKTGGEISTDNKDRGGISIGHRRRAECENEFSI